LLAQATLQLKRIHWGDENIELDGIRPSTAVPPFGMRPKPSRIDPGDFLQCVCHRNRYPF
jgi:hypothetical protein